jgi:hypothetical protein
MMKPFDPASAAPWLGVKLTRDRMSPDLLNRLMTIPGVARWTWEL